MRFVCGLCRYGWDEGEEVRRNAGCEPLLCNQQSWEMLAVVPVYRITVDGQSKHRASTVFRSGEASDPLVTMRLLEAPWLVCRLVPYE